MKQFIVLSAMVALGIFVFQLIAGPDESSIVNLLGSAWSHEILLRTATP
ncbi:MAG: hypothetical protein PHC40_04370 [Eubacteriales bacterium]|nr:hypothetical protein [Eubacteriales bacterium]